MSSNLSKIGGRTLPQDEISNPILTIFGNKIDLIFEEIKNDLV